MSRAKIKNKWSYVFNYRYVSLNDGDMFWEMRRGAILLLNEHHEVYIHKPR
jgi:hypothetical protein